MLNSLCVFVCIRMKYYKAIIIKYTETVIFSVLSINNDITFQSSALH